MRFAGTCCAVTYKFIYIYIWLIKYIYLYVDTLSANNPSISLPAFVGPVLFVAGKVFVHCVQPVTVTYTLRDTYIHTIGFFVQNKFINLRFAHFDLKRFLCSPSLGRSFNAPNIEAMGGQSLDLK